MELYWFALALLHQRANLWQHRYPNYRYQVSSMELYWFALALLHQWANQWQHRDPNY